MSLFGAIKEKVFKEFIDIIEWTDSSSDTMVWRFPRYQAEIKNGAQLTVRETQLAVLVNEGQFADVFQPGRYELTTQNMPILTTLKGWKYGFNSPFKVDVYFVNTKEFLNQRWGTSNPIMMRDPEFGPIRLRAFGSFNIRIQSDPIPFIRKVLGTNEHFTTEGIREQLRNFVITKFSDYLGESKIAALDLAANLNEFSQSLFEKLCADFADYGLDLTKFLIENISLPESVEQALDRRTSMGVIGNMNAYTQMQFANSLEKGAVHGGSPAGDAMGMGMGFAMASQMANQVSQGLSASPSGQATGAMPPPVPEAVLYHVALDGKPKGPFSKEELIRMHEAGSLSPDSLVWTAGMSDWASASSIPALNELFGATPPPLPKE
ncbi:MULTISPECIES: SPFH domain-containing protein [Porphyromonas]|uniref:Antifreeze protein n=1 Tax=Porphyromonas canoris TaxID=36875 RepID=A0ABR4XNF9_9PORP|nr:MULTISPECIES: SPFH domain-containing protein [Porphyromonas]KGN67310.1 antifreeze protein [Porphyromonas sp. COT-108 OH1349]KGN93320.1 antifreeze protein [Porphyromonas canoris]